MAAKDRFHAAVRIALEKEQWKITEPSITYEAFFKREFAQLSLEKYQIKLIIYDPVQEVILQWIP